MQNVITEVQGTTLIIKVDLSKSFGASKSGKTEIVASTQGNQQINGVCVGLNVYKARKL